MSACPGSQRENTLRPPLRARLRRRLYRPSAALGLGLVGLMAAAPGASGQTPPAPPARAPFTAALRDAAGTPEQATAVRLQPWAVVVGGLQQEWVGQRDGTVGSGERMEAIQDDREDRSLTLAMSRFGLNGAIGEHVEVHTEFEVNRGPHGTSVWEAQAALQVRDQWLRVRAWRLSAEVGRITDEASVDYSSGHVGDQLLMDPYTRVPLLESGYNQGNGLKLRFDAPAGLQAAVTFNAANPTSMTTSYMVAGKYSNGLYTRLHRFAGSRIASSPSKYPDDAQHMTVLTPSLTWRWRWIEAQGAMQLLSANLDTNGTEDDPVEGWNLRGGLRLHLLGGMLQPFVNASRVAHTTLAYQADDKTQVWEGQGWVTTTVGGGLDINPWGRSGLGVQLVRAHAQQGDGSRVERADVWFNLGATWWIADSLALGTRLALWSADQRDQRYNSTLADWEPTRFSEGERSLFVTLRKELR